MGRILLNFQPIFSDSLKQRDRPWIDFDPTSGKVGKVELVTVAVVRDPRHAVPLHGTFIGFPSDHLGMEVEVIVRKRSEPLSNTPGAPGLANGHDR